MTVPSGVSRPTFSAYTHTGAPGAVSYDPGHRAPRPSQCGVELPNQKGWTPLLLSVSLKHSFQPWAKAEHQSGPL